MANQYVVPALEKAKQQNISVESLYHNGYLKREYLENKEVVEKNKKNLMEAFQKYIQENSLDEEFFRGEMFEKLIHWLPKNPVHLSLTDTEKLNEAIIVEKIQYLYDNEEDRRGLLLEILYPGARINPGDRSNKKNTLIYTTIWWIKDKKYFEGQWTHGGSFGKKLEFEFFEGNQLWKDGGYFKGKEIFRPNIYNNKELCAHHMLGINGVLFPNYVVIEFDNDYYKNIFSKIFKKFIINSQYDIMEIPLVLCDSFPNELNFKKLTFYKLPLPGTFEADRYEVDVELGGTIERIGLEITPQNELELYCNVASLEYLHYAFFREEKIDTFIWGGHVGSFKNKFADGLLFHFD